jgi:phospholipid transport system transporter-binding protein
MLQTEDDRILITGDLTFDSVPELWQDAQSLLKSASFTVVDLAAVNRADSAGVAMLVAWLGLAQQQHYALRFINATAQLQALVRSAGLSELLALDDAATNPL